MILKFQAPVPGEQPNIAFGGLATMQMPNGPRIGVLYAELTITKAASAGVATLPVLTDIASPTLPMFVKIGGKPLIQRLASELIADNLLQDFTAGGSVAYYQGGVLVARVNNANNASPTGLGLALNTATTAVFQVPIYFAQYYRKDLPTAEGLSIPTAFINPANASQPLYLAPLTVEVPVTAANTSAVNPQTPGTIVATSAPAVKFWYDYDGLQWPLTNGKPVSMLVKKGRFTKAYAVAGDLTVALPMKDQLMQFSLLLATGDTWNRIQLRLNGTTLKDITPDRLNQVLFDHQMNILATIPNRVDVIMDLNDDLNAALPIQPTDTFEVVVTLASVAAAAQMVILTEYYGLPD